LLIFSPTHATPVKTAETQGFLREGGNNKGTLDILFDSIVELYVLDILFDSVVELYALMVWPLNVVVSNGKTLFCDTTKL